MMKKEDTGAALRDLVSSTAALCDDDDDADEGGERGMSELVSLLQRSRAQRLPPPSFALAPAVPLPLWQRVALSSLQSREAALQSQRKFKHVRHALARDLTRYHLEVRERAEKQLRQQREARARAGERVAAGIRRYWSRRGDAYQQLAKVEFDVMKHQRDRRKQEDLLRETEELTRKLLESIFSATAASRRHAAGATGSASPSASVDVEGCESAHDSAAATTFWERVGDDGGDDGDGDGGGDGAPIEAALSLLDTEGGRRPLRHYQRSALRWLVHLYENNLNGILADEMGLGKTVQTIALLCYFAEYRNDWGPHLVVVPTTVVLNWKAELERWAPGLKVLTYIGSAKERHQLRKGWTSEDAFHVCVTSYNLVVQDRAVFRRRPWGFLVLDEAHQVKNFMSLKWQSLFDLQAEYRLLLTGTPLQNSIMELWSLFHFLLPFASAFRSNAEFKEWFSNPMDEMITGRTSLNEGIVRRLQSLLRPFMLRRLKKDVETQLPTKTERVVLCHLSRRQRALYDDYMQLAETRQKLRGGGGSGAGGVLSVLLALRKVCDHPDLFEERPTVSPLVLGHEAVLVRRVPRAVLLLSSRGAEGRGRWRFPRLCVVDVNDDDAEAARDIRGVPASTTLHDESRSDSAAGAVPWWLVLTAVSRHDAPTGAAMALFAERFRPAHVAEVPARQPCKAAAAAAASDAAAVGGCSAALAAAYAGVLAQARAEAAQRRRRTADAQQQRYQALQAARNTYVPPTCVLTLRQAAVARQHPRLCPTVAERAVALLPIVERVCVYVPAVLAAHPPRLHWSLPIADPRPFTLLDREACAPLVGAVAKAQDAAQRGCVAPRRCFDAAFFLRELWPIQVRRSFSFPDKRLLIHDCGKLQFLETTMKELRQDGHRVLIFTQFVHMLNILERFLALIGVAYMRLDGATKAELRQQYVDRFNADPRITCMILSTRSGGIGLNLTGADTVIFYDSDWNPTMDLQAQDRCHRIGQTRPVTIYRLISEHTVEESILAKARERKKLNNVVIRGGQFHSIAGVSDQYDDSAAAFAALADPVNLRSFFHDLDEDATTSAASVDTATAPLDLLAAMEDVEDEEDRAAGQELRREMAAHAAEEAADGGSDDGDSATADGSFAKAGDDAAAAAQQHIAGDKRWRVRLPNSLLDALLAPLQPAGGSAEAQESEAQPAAPPSAAVLMSAVRKRQREVVRKAHAPVDQLLALQYGRCRRADAEERYDALAVSYEAEVRDDSDASDLEDADLAVFRPRFRAEYRLGS
ncbi:SWI/SNF-related helicase [Novymonas esmeraldas]|uniref:SWI/SNF-related helicase n=1 Tax=Novymonas esmeraldas TaxID=1808958 RepID=A0AAW0EIV9_9TRYP